MEIEVRIIVLLLNYFWRILYHRIMGILVEYGWMTILCETTESDFNLRLRSYTSRWLAWSLKSFPRIKSNFSYQPILNGKWSEDYTIFFEFFLVFLYHNSWEFWIEYSWVTILCETTESDFNLRILHYTSRWLGWSVESFSQIKIKLFYIICLESGKWCENSIVFTEILFADPLWQNNGNFWSNMV